MDAHIFRIVNTYGRLRELGPEVDWKYYVILMKMLSRT